MNYLMVAPLNKINRGESPDYKSIEQTAPC